LLIRESIRNRKITQERSETVATGPEVERIQLLRKLNAPSDTLKAMTAAVD